MAQTLTAKTNPVALDSLKQINAIVIRAIDFHLLRTNYCSCCLKL